MKDEKVILVDYRQILLEWMAQHGKVSLEACYNNGPYHYCTSNWRKNFSTVMSSLVQSGYVNREGGGYYGFIRHIEPEQLRKNKVWRSGALPVFEVLPSSINEEKPTGYMNVEDLLGKGDWRLLQEGVDYYVPKELARSEKWPRLYVELCAWVKFLGKEIHFHQYRQDCCFIVK